MTKRFQAALLLGAALSLSPSAQAAPHKLMVLSIDGLDWRYLRDGETLGMKLPNIRKLLARSEVADGVTGVWPTVTWPSHTTMLTGLPPDRHGILANAGGPLDITQSYWSYKKIAAPTLTQCVREAGRTVGAVNWPVTVEAPINWNLPEVYARRNGDSSDMDTVERYGTPGLVAEIGKALPSFNQQWLDDRSRTLAATYILKTKHPDLMLVHLAESDSEQHEEGPYTPHAKAVLERSDELVGDVLKALPKDYALALVSDHGFEAVDHIANLPALAAADGGAGTMTITAGMVISSDAGVIAWLRAQMGKGEVGREIPAAELAHYAPRSSGAAFEPAPHVMFGSNKEKSITPSGNKGNHGFWPTRPDYHSVFLLSGPGIKAGKLGTIDMTSLDGRFESVLGLTCPHS